MKPHVHAEVIKAWADGAEIEARFRNSLSHDFGPWRKQFHPTWNDNGFAEYRVKSPLVVQEACLRWRNCDKQPILSLELGANYEHLRNVRFTFEDGKLVKAEVI